MNSIDTPTNHRRFSEQLFFSIATIALLLALIIALHAGAYSLRWSQLPEIINGHGNAAIVFCQIRLPRVVLAILIGAGLGLIGAALQGLFRNPMADPGLLGVSSGSALAVGIIMVLGSQLFPSMTRSLSIFTYPIAAFVGGALVTSLIYRLGQSIQGVSIRIKR